MFKKKHRVLIYQVRAQLRSLNENVAGLPLFVLVISVLLFVPQVFNVWWELPYRATGDDVGLVAGFWAFVIGIALFYLAVLARPGPIGGQCTAALLAASCIVGAALVLVRVRSSVGNGPMPTRVWAASRWWWPRAITCRGCRCCSRIGTGPGSRSGPRCASCSGRLPTRRPSGEGRPEGGWC
jgi:hypothetical protein